MLSGVISARATSIPAMAVTETHIFWPLLIRMLSVTSLLLPLNANLVRAFPEKSVNVICADLMAFMRSLFSSTGVGALTGAALVTTSCFFALQPAISSKQQRAISLLYVLK